MLYEKSEDILSGLYKSASFVVQAIVFLQTGNYISHQAELQEIAAREEREILSIFRHLKNGGGCRFDQMSDLLFTWAQSWIEKTAQ